MLHGLASQFRPHVWLNVHSGMEAMFTPYDHKAFVSTVPCKVCMTAPTTAALDGQPTAAAQATLSVVNCIYQFGNRFSRRICAIHARHAPLTTCASCVFGCAQVPEAAAPAMALLKQIQTDIMKGTGCVIGSGGKTVG